MKKTFATLILLALLAVACGDPDPTIPGAGGAVGAGGGAAGTCLVGTPDCNDTPDTPMGSDSGGSMAMCIETPEPEECNDMVVTGPGGGSSDEPRAQRVRPRPGMNGLHKVGWDAAKPKGNRKVIVEFWSGVEPCYVLDHVDVQYGVHTVTITLWEGSDPAQEDEACIEIALLKGTKVKLSEPLGDREVVDGAE